MGQIKVRIQVGTAPTAKARPRFATGGRTYKSKGQVEAEREFQTWASIALRKARYSIKAVPPDLPLFVKLWYIMPRPKRVKANGFHVLRPDTDNLVKFTLDCLNGYAWKDDAQVSMIFAAKLYWEGEPRVVIEIESVEDFDIEQIFDAIAI